MVCAKCEKKERELGLGLVTADVWKPIGKGNDERSDTSSRKVGENKLLSSKRKMKMMPYMVPDMKSKVKQNSQDKGEGSSKSGSSSSSKKSLLAGGAVSECKKCKDRVAKPGAKYCQGCAYKSGICSQCGVPVLENISQYKMSSK